MAALVNARCIAVLRQHAGAPANGRDLSLQILVANATIAAGGGLLYASVIDFELRQYACSSSLSKN